jgi:hypothetical protein
MTVAQTEDMLKVRSLATISGQLSTDYMAQFVKLSEEHAQVKVDKETLITTNIELARRLGVSERELKAAQEGSCSLCFNPPVKLLLNPECGHTMCEECTLKVERCPFCHSANVKIANCIRVFHA